MVENTRISYFKGLSMAVEYAIELYKLIGQELAVVALYGFHYVLPANDEMVAANPNQVRFITLDGVGYSCEGLPQEEACQSDTK